MAKSHQLINDSVMLPWRKKPSSNTFLTIESKRTVLLMAGEMNSCVN